MGALRALGGLKADSGSTPTGSRLRDDAEVLATTTLRAQPRSVGVDGLMRQEAQVTATSSPYW